MKKLINKLSLVVLLSVIISLNLTAQDGSDIHYVKNSKISSNLIGEFIHIDFYRKSFFGLDIDTINILIDKKDISFTEVRNDDGYNNWFSQQYLESIETFNGKKLRVEKMKVINVNSKTIDVKLLMHYFDKEGNSKPEPFKIQFTSFPREIISEILIDSKPQIQNELSIYQIYHSFPDSTKKSNLDCYYCFEADIEDLFHYPLISGYEFTFFNQKKERKYLQRIASRLKIPSQGLPVVLTLNGEIIYGFWLWDEKSAFKCDRVHVYPKLDFKVELGLPVNNTFGNDGEIFYRWIEKYLNDNYINFDNN